MLSSRLSTELRTTGCHDLYLSLLPYFTRNQHGKAQSCREPNLFFSGNLHDDSGCLNQASCKHSVSLRIFIPSHKCVCLSKEFGVTILLWKRNLLLIIPSEIAVLWFVWITPSVSAASNPNCNGSCLHLSIKTSKNAYPLARPIL